MIQSFFNSVLHPVFPAFSINLFCFDLILPQKFDRAAQMITLNTNTVFMRTRLSEQNYILVTVIFQCHAYFLPIIVINALTVLLLSPETHTAILICQREAMPTSVGPMSTLLTKHERCG